MLGAWGGCGVLVRCAWLLVAKRQSKGCAQMPTATNDRRAYIRRRSIEVAVKDGAVAHVTFAYLALALVGLALATCAILLLMIDF